MLTDSLQQVESLLRDTFSVSVPPAQKVYDAALYSLMLPGKRVRPTLTLLFAQACCGSSAHAVPFAAAVEMIHTYSLIHDDLPAMDDDDFRRGQPSNHKVFGEDIAILAGDALHSAAYTAMLSDAVFLSVGAESAARAAYVLSEKSGIRGMVGGQTTDVMSEGRRVGIDTMTFMDEGKTAALIEAACMMGCIVSGGDSGQIAAAESYGRHIGMAFQIIDDILDVTSTTEELGKPVGSDAENRKSTYVSLLGIERCRQLADEYTRSALDALSVFEGDTTSLAEFALQLRDRRK